VAGWQWRGGSGWQLAVGMCQLAVAGWQCGNWQWLGGSKFALARKKNPQLILILTKKNQIDAFLADFWPFFFGKKMHIFAKKCIFLAKKCIFFC
jgi:hypothetical protein